MTSVYFVIIMPNTKRSSNATNVSPTPLFLSLALPATMVAASVLVTAAPLLTPRLRTPWAHQLEGHVVEAVPAVAEVAVAEVAGLRRN